MRNKFKRNTANKKTLLRNICIVIFILLFLIGIVLLSISFKNIIEISKVDERAKNVSDEIASKSNPILVNNLLLGAVYNNTWVSSEKFYFHNEITKDTNVDIYTANGKKGTYKLETMTKVAKGSDIYISTSNTNKNDEYVAVVSSDKDIMSQPAVEYTNITEENYKSVKKALGIYRLLNSSINIVEAYDINIDINTKGRIYFLNNKVGKGIGGYSAIIYEDMTGSSKIIKYSFVSNLKNSSDWPIYSFKFIADLNEDDKNEIIIQETREFDVKYDIIEYRDDRFIEVLSSEMKL